MVSVNQSGCGSNYDVFPDLVRSPYSLQSIIQSVVAIWPHKVREATQAPDVVICEKIIQCTPSPSLSKLIIDIKVPSTSWPTLQQIPHQLCQLTVKSSSIWTNSLSTELIIKINCHEIHLTHCQTIKSYQSLDELSKTLHLSIKRPSEIDISINGSTEPPKISDNLTQAHLHISLPNLTVIVPVGRAPQS